MDIVVTGRHRNVTDRFRAHVEDKLSKVTQLAPRARRVEVMISHEPNRRQSKACERVEITCLDKGPLVRAEACEDDLYAALDIAMEKLMERLRRRNDKRLVRRRHRVAAAALSAGEAAGPLAASEPDGEGAGDEFDGSPVEVREKVHRSHPMSLGDALGEMEAVGHDFYLFHDIETDKASVVYRRHGWSYGVLHLDLTGEESAAV